MWIEVYSGLYIIKGNFYLRHQNTLECREFVNILFTGKRNKPTQAVSQHQEGLVKRTRGKGLKQPLGTKIEAQILASG